MKVEVAVLGSPSLTVLKYSCGRKATLKKKLYKTEFRSCVKVEMAVLGSPVPISTYGLCGRKATLKKKLCKTELSSCVKVEVAVLGFPSLIILMVSVDVKQH